MALSESILQADIRAALKAASDAANEDPVPSDSEILDLISQKLATAIHDYVSAADVTDVQTQVTGVATDVSVGTTPVGDQFVGSGTQAGAVTASQTGTGHLA